MADEVIGISVLVGNRLYIVCRSDQPFRVDINTIPVSRPGRPRAEHPVWCVAPNGDRLSVTPSVCISYPNTEDCPAQLRGQVIFHNAGQWETRFVEVPEDADGYEECLKLNRELMIAVRSAHRGPDASFSDATKPPG